MHHRPADWSARALAVLTLSLLSGCPAQMGAVGPDASTPFAPDSATLLVDAGLTPVVDAGAEDTTDGGAPARMDAGVSPTSDAGTDSFSVLFFSKTAGFRHGSIPAARTAMALECRRASWACIFTEDTVYLTEASLLNINVVVFLNTTGDILDPSQQDALEAFVRRGGGWVGVHSASDTEYDWPFYQTLVGAPFRSHPAIQKATVMVENAAHPATKHLPATWIRTDEWYNFKTNPRSDVTVLLKLDETSYQPGNGAMGADHPAAWSRSVEGGRSFYTALGHTDESWSEPDFIKHVIGGILWTGRRAP